MVMCIFILYMKLQLIAAVAMETHAASPPEVYWKSMLPTTAMPKSIAALLHLSGNFSAELAPQIIFHYGYNYYNYIWPRSSGRHVYGRPSQFETKLHDNSDTALYFLEKDLKAGRKMNFLFVISSNQASFLPRDVVKSIPFSLSKMAEILNKFGVKPGSINAKVMKHTIEVCEDHTAIKGEEKYCATSLESMLDFTIMKLGKDAEPLSTELMNNETKKQEYRIMNGVKKVGETKVVVCHKLDYVYAVFYCHKINNTVAYTVSLEGTDGSTVKAVSICHRDTSAWNPKHLAFQMLKVKPGSVSICHILFKDTIAWLPKQN